MHSHWQCLFANVIHFEQLLPSIGSTFPAGYGSTQRELLRAISHYRQLFPICFLELHCHHALLSLDTQLPALPNVPSETVGALLCRRCAGGEPVPADWCRVQLQFQTRPCSKRCLKAIVLLIKRSEWQLRLILTLILPFMYVLFSMSFFTNLLISLIIQKLINNMVEKQFEEFSKGAIRFTNQNQQFGKSVINKAMKPVKHFMGGG